MVIAAEGVDLDSVDLAEVDTLAADKGATAVPGEPAVIARDEAGEWAELPSMFFQLVEDELPELKAVYTPERCRAWGAAMIPIAKKYNWTPDQFLAWLGPWIALTIASHRLVTPTAKAIAVRIRQYREEAAEKAAEEARPTPSA